MSVDLGSLGAADVAATFTDETPEQHEQRSMLLRSQWDTFYNVLARRSESGARIIRENESTRKALHTAASWVLDFCNRKGLPIWLVDVRGSLSRDGNIILTIRQKEAME